MFKSWNYIIYTDCDWYLQIKTYQHTRNNIVSIDLIEPKGWISVSKIIFYLNSCFNKKIEILNNIVHKIIIKRRGHKIEPCGTPAVILFHSLQLEPIQTLWNWFDR